MCIRDRFLTVAYIFSVLTIYYAPLSLTASSRYSVIVFGIIFGYIILNEIPSSNMIIGASIISFSGLFVINREKKLGKNQRGKHTYAQLEPVNMLELRPAGLLAPNPHLSFKMAPQMYKDEYVLFVGRTSPA